VESAVHEDKTYVSFGAQKSLSDKGFQKRVKVDPVAWQIGLRRPISSHRATSD
jgi:hypothetical protein